MAVLGDGADDLRGETITARISGFLGRPIVAAGAVLLSMAALLVALRTSYFQGDDFLNFEESRVNGLSWTWLNSPLFGHWLPARRALDWGLGLTQPISWEATLLLMVLLVGTIALFVRLVVIELTRSAAWGTVAAVALPLLGAVSGTVQWYAGAAQVLPAMVCATVLQWLCLRMIGARPVRVALLVVAMVALLAVGLVFDERTAVLALIAPLLLALRLGVLGAVKPAIVAYVGIVPTIAIWYFVQDRITQDVASPMVLQPVQTAVYLGRAAVEAILPGLAGWVSRPALGGEVAVIVVGALVALLLAVCVAVGRRHGRSVLAVLILLATIVLIHLPVAVVRVPEFGTSGALESRYSAMAMPVALILAVVLAQQGVRAIDRRAWGARAIVALAVLFAASATVNLVYLSTANTGVVVRSWMENVTADSAALDARHFYNVPVNPVVVPGGFYPHSMTGIVLPLILDGVDTRVTSAQAALVRTDGTIEVVAPSGSRPAPFVDVEALTETSPGCYSTDGEIGRLWFELPEISTGQLGVRIITVEGEFPDESIRLLAGPTEDTLRDKTAGVGGYPPSTDSALWVTTEEFADSRVLAIEVPDGSVCVDSVTVGVVEP